MTAPDFIACVCSLGEDPNWQQNRNCLLSLQIYTQKMCMQSPARVSRTHVEGTASGAGCEEEYALLVASASGLGVVEGETVARHIVSPKTADRAFANFEKFANTIQALPEPRVIL